MQLRGYQEKFFSRVRERYSAGVNRQLGVLATGLGKAVLFAALREQMGFERKIMVLVHREELANQAAARFASWNPELRIGIEMADRWADVDGIFPSTLIVASVPTLGRRGSSRIKKFLPQDFDCIVSDECFPTGTLIDGKPIENICVGDSVLSYDESSRTIEKRAVLRLYRNPIPEYLVRIQTAKGNFLCTAGHPIYTERGWINAIDINTHDRLMFSVQSSGRSIVTADAETANFPQDWPRLLLGSMQGRSRVISEVRSYDPHQLETLFCADEGEQSYAPRECEREDGSHIESNGAQAEGAWRKRNRTHEATANAGSGFRVGNRSLRSHWTLARKWLSSFLQTGRGKCGIEDRHRSGRELPRTIEPPTARLQERCTLVRIGVDRVTVEKRPHFEQPSQLPKSGYVYNLEVEGTHTYFANGFLVHNCHHSSSPQWRNVLTHFGVHEPNDSHILSLGLTATPNRSDGVGLRQNFDEIVFDMGIRDGIQSGYLVDLCGIRVATKTNLDQVHSRAGDFAEDELSDAVNTPERNAIIVKEWYKVAFGLKSVAFTVDIQHAIDLAAAFRKFGVDAQAVWGADPERADKLRKHRAGEITILCNCAVLTEGYDDPGIKCIVLAKPTKSALLFTQMIGRGTRIDDGKTDCKIIDVVDSTTKHSLVTMPSLLGLPANFDLKGKSVIKAKEQFEQVEKEYPTADLSSITSLNNLKSIAENISLFQVHYPPEIGKLSELAWRKSGDGYCLTVNRNLLTISKDLRDEYQIRGTVNGSPVEQSAQNLSGAFNVADSLIPKDFIGVLKRNARWKDDVPTDKQRSLCRILKINIPPGATKGAVSAAIDNKRMQQVKA